MDKRQRKRFILHVYIEMRWEEKHKAERSVSYKILPNFDSPSVISLVFILLAKYACKMFCSMPSEVVFNFLFKFWGSVNTDTDLSKPLRFTIQIMSANKDKVTIKVLGLPVLSFKSIIQIYRMIEKGRKLWSWVWGLYSCTNNTVWILRGLLFSILFTTIVNFFLFVFKWVREI